MSPPRRCRGSKRGRRDLPLLVSQIESPNGVGIGKYPPPTNVVEGACPRDPGRQQIQAERARVVLRQVVSFRNSFGAPFAIESWSEALSQRTDPSAGPH